MIEITSNRLAALSRASGCGFFAFNSLINTFVVALGAVYFITMALRFTVDCIRVFATAGALPSLDSSACLSL